MFVDDWEYNPETLEVLESHPTQPMRHLSPLKYLVHKPQSHWMVTPSRSQTIALLRHINNSPALGATSLLPVLFENSQTLAEFLSCSTFEGSQIDYQSAVRTIRRTPGQKKVLTIDELNDLLGGTLGPTLRKLPSRHPVATFDAIMELEVSREASRALRTFPRVGQPYSFIGSSDPEASFWDDRHFTTVTELKQLSLAEFRRTAAPTIIKQSDQDELQLPEATLRLMEDAQNLLFLPDPQYQLVPEILWLTRGPAGYEGNYFLSEHTWIGDDIAWIAGRVAPVPADIEQFPSTGYLYELGLHRTHTKDQATRTLPLDVLGAVNQNA